VAVEGRVVDFRGLSGMSEGVVTEGLLKSKAVPGVFGVFVVDPNDAKAPEPSPNAEDAPGAAFTFVFKSDAPFGSAARVGVSEPERLREGKWRE